MRFFAATILALLMGVPARAEEADLRNFRVGMPASELPAEGYTDFTCAGSKTNVQGWPDYVRCPADAAGLHALRFSYQEGSNDLAFVNDTYEGTKVGGHPVLLTLLISDAGVVEGLRIETDPAARLNRRKKAYLLGELAKGRYGENGWTCTEAQPGAGEEPVGGMFMKEHCEKTTPTRRYVLDRQMFHKVGADQRGFISASQLEIRRPG